jgi:hypothetical protein
LGAYQLGLDLPLGECANIFFCRTSPGDAVGVAWDKKKIKQGRDVFVASLDLWKKVKNYNSGFKPAKIGELLDNSDDV